MQSGVRKKAFEKEMGLLGMYYSDSWLTISLERQMKKSFV